MTHRLRLPTCLLTWPLWAACAGCWAQAAAPEPVTAPQWKVGDQWAYELTVNPGDTCTKSLTTGAQETVEVVAAGAEGYELLRTTNGNKIEQKVALDFTMVSKVGFTLAKADPFGFPIPRAKPWPSDHIRSGSVGTVKTELICEHRAKERLAVPAGEFEVIPIVCEGTWANISFRSGGKSTWKYWYAPAVRNFIKTSVLTFYQGNTCVDLAWNLKVVK